MSSQPNEAPASHAVVEKPHPKFKSRDQFLPELRRRVDAYFESTGKRPRDCAKMYVKTVFIASWFVASYVGLVFFATTWWMVIPLTISLGLAMAAVGFNIQHDGGHKAYSNHKWVNKLTAMSLDIVGGSSYLWDWKHNAIHHTYTNITDEDDDINVGIFGRMSPHQPHLPFHRLQCIYIWFLYGLLAIKWQLFDDFYRVIRPRIASHRIPRPKGKDLVIFVGGKVVFFSLAFVIPMLLHPFWIVLGVYVLMACVSGVVLSVVFQLAHCVEEAEFPMPSDMPDGSREMDSAWAVHQVQTTVNFARGNRVLSFFLGGLNYQIEHHLFHRICHVHYPALSKVVEETCRDFGIKYQEHKTFTHGIWSHFKFLLRMGNPRTAG